MIQINHYMSHQLWCHLCLSLLRLGGYTVNLSDLYSYRLIGKLTAFFQIQEFSFRNLIVDSSTSANNKPVLATRSLDSVHAHP